MISIIVPVYKVEPFLRTCVDSILHQTYEDFEVLLIDDGSPDRCGEICEEYKRRDKRVKVFHKENEGLAASRNFGLREAKGCYIGFVDSDDWIEPDMLQVLLRRLEDAKADICISGYWYDTDSMSKEARLEEAIYDRKEALKALLEGKINNAVWNKLYSKEMFNNIVFPEGRNYEDIAVMHEILYKAQKVTTVSALEYHYRIRRESITKTYTASNVIDFADAYLTRYAFYRDELKDVFSGNKVLMLRNATRGISKVWRWWYGCSPDEKKMYTDRLKVYEKFSKEYIPLFGFSSWPIYLRASAFFMHYGNNASFAVIYRINQFFRKVWPATDNIEL